MIGFNFAKLVILGQWLLTKRVTSAAIDITQRCNLKCLHCYWWKQDHPAELSDRDLVRLMEGLRRKGLRAAILYGGEPTLREDMCRAASRIFDATLVFTNGTNGFPDLGNAQWVLSLDGPREANDRIRGKGVYDLAVENLLKAPKPPIVHATISRLNEDRIGEFVEAMLDLPVKGIGFSFFTPDLGSKDSDLFIPLSRRNRLVEKLLSLRKRYGERVAFTPAMARQLLTEGRFREWNRFTACPVSKRVWCYKSNGERKACTYGDDADCSRCGCAAVVAYRAALRPLNYRSLRVVLGLILPEYEGSPHS